MNNSDLQGMMQFIGVISLHIVFNHVLPSISREVNTDVVRIEVLCPCPLSITSL